MAIEPQGAAEVAKIFLKRVNRFFIYEEYGAKYELMIKDVAAAHRMMPGWPSYQKGLEILASSLASADNSRDEGRKSLTIGDLLVKPIQRVCKYPLLFSELLKHTPVIDCPHAHMDIETTLVRLREATAEINRATNDSRTKSVLEKTWILQDRLAFPYQLDAASKNRIRSFGHIRLCGALHVCWQTKEGVDGQYMIALLYREWLCLATAGRVGQIYTIRACIAVANISLEDVDNGRADPDGQEQMQSDIFSFLSLNIKSLGTVFRKPGTIARRMSIHRATTLGPKSPLCQVILKNTSAVKDPPAPGYGSRINRSQSLLTTNSRIPVLAPSRDERARLEALLSDVWTRDVLPFPGITARSRSDHLVRTSASSMMRKFSGSITNGFNRRSASLASLQLKEKVGLGLDGEATSPSERRRTASIGTLYPQHAQERSAPLADPAERRASSPPRPRRAPVTLESDRSRTVRRRDTYASCITLDGRAVDGKGDDGDDGDGGKGGDCDDDASPLRSPSASIMLRKSSGNSPSRASFQRSARSEMAPSSVLDERCRPLGEPRGRNQARPSHSHKLSDRLAKARAKHREVVVQGIRSWFR
ncbi:361aa38e-7d85-4211-88c4-0c911d764b6a [Thermothielavioides terrestris]|uniref:361aa38e-7d85-4211-88c4-0c911d764b6a n=1 Tax=Thermothielavioides terrestris TaxID=2587410 RepID=A0A3S4AIC2_9PEZI|nr:361aa38e-7d85-4211-88c4-0c911d764b6a [Thermothielavioides terrestris]